jgi:hypothetical protein
MKKHLFIRLQVQDGERQHDHKVLHNTKANNIEFAAQRYVSTFWGKGEREDDFWWFDGEITARLEKVVEITEKEYNRLYALFY